MGVMALFDSHPLPVYNSQVENEVTKWICLHKNFVGKKFHENSVNWAIYTTLTFHNTDHPWPSSVGQDPPDPHGGCAYGSGDKLGPLQGHYDTHRIACVYSMSIRTAILVGLRSCMRTRIWENPKLQYRKVQYLLLRYLCMCRAERSQTWQPFRRQ